MSRTSPHDRARVHLEGLETALREMEYRDPAAWQSGYKIFGKSLTAMFQFTQHHEEMAREQARRVPRGEAEGIDLVFLLNTGGALQVDRSLLPDDRASGEAGQVPGS